MGQDPAPYSDLPSDIAFRFFLAGIDPEEVALELPRALREPERSYFEAMNGRLGP